MCFSDGRLYGVAVKMRGLSLMLGCVIEGGGGDWMDMGRAAVSVFQYAMGDFTGQTMGCVCEGEWRGPR